jgi:fido (protein-threonine AMPylation protein)
MIAAIAAASARLAALPPHLGEPLRKRFARSEAVAFVVSSNWLEQVGTQDDAETQALCERATAAAAGTDRKSRETMQTLLALRCAHRLREEARTVLAVEGAASHQVLLVTPDSQCEIHAELMRGLVAQPGCYRLADARPQGYYFLYPSPADISNRMLQWTDAVNDLVTALPAVTLPCAFQLAALVLFHSVDVHAFQDGNGRLCRILASAMLSEHHFFPVALQPLTASLGGDEDSSRRHLAWRSIYIDAIEACRGDAARRPADLAALLIESSWAAWQRVEALVAQTVDGEGAALLGAIVLGRRVGLEARARVEARWGSLNHCRRLGGRPGEGSAAQEEDIARLCAAAGGGGATARVRLQDGCVVLVYTA